MAFADLLLEGIVIAKSKFKRGRAARFIQLEHWMLDSVAWKNLKPGPRALYVELKKRFNGSNNGRIFLSHRQAAEALCVGRDTVGGYYKKLMEHGFLVETRGHYLGPFGVGKSASYSLTELPLNGQPATKEFMKWQKQKPRRKTRHSLAGKTDTHCRKTQPLDVQKTENPTANGKKPNVSVSENPAIYTSNHVPSKDLACANIFQLADYCEFSALQTRPDLCDTTKGDKISAPI